MKIRAILVLLPVLLLPGCGDGPALKAIVQEVLLVGQQDRAGSLTGPFSEQFPLARHTTDSGATYQTRFGVNEKLLRKTNDLVLVRIASGTDNRPLRAEAYAWKSVRIQNGFLTLPGQQFYPARAEHLQFLLVRPRRVVHPIPIGGLPLFQPSQFLRDYRIVQRLRIRPEILQPALLPRRAAAMRPGTLPVPARTGV